MYSISPKQAYNAIRTTVLAGLTPLLISSPGVGKSSIVQQFAKDNNLKLIDLRLSQCTPEDLNGFPMRNGNKATFTPFDVFPLVDDKIPEGYTGFLLFLDEMTSASKPVQVAAYKLILDRMVGSHKIHPNTFIVAAGNKATDKAVVNKLSTALQSRMIHFDLEVNKNDWMEIAIEKGFDHRVRAFIEYMPNKLMSFDPNHNENTFPCPRTWEFVSRLVKDEPITEEQGHIIAGAIGSGTATEFITFAQVFHDLPKFNDIIVDPEGANIPHEVSTKFATVSMLIEHTTADNLDKVLIYIKRLAIEMQIIFCRSVVIKDPKIRTTHKGFADFVSSLARHLQ